MKVLGDGPEQMNPSLMRMLKPGDEATLEAFLRPRLESSMFLLGNLREAGIVDGQERYQGLYVANFDRDQICGVVAHYWNGNLLPQAPLDLNQADTFERMWRFAVQASRRRIHGIVGPADQVNFIKKSLGLVPEQLQMDEIEILYALDLTALELPAALARNEVAARRIQASDVDQLTNWLVAYNIETLGAADSPELRRHARMSIERQCREGNLWLLESDGSAVSMSGFNAAISEAVQVGPVYTPPEERNKGYARAVVAASLLDARNRGVRKGVLFTGENEVPAQRAYSAIGFRPIGRYGLTLLQEPVMGTGSG